MSKNILITGCATGFGRELAKAALAAGHHVVATDRNPATLDDLTDRYPDLATAVGIDISDTASVHDGVAHAADALGNRIDVLVNNAGYGEMGAVEEVSEERMFKQFNTNVFGLHRMLRACLPIMRRQRSGHIVNLSSVGGHISFAGAAVYCSSKFAIEGLSEGLAQEVGPLGIKVTMIEPGSFRTNFGPAMGAPYEPIDDYADTAGKWVEFLKNDWDIQPGDPVKAALAILNVIESASPPLRLALGPDALKSIREKLAAVEKEAAEWEAVTVTTDRDDLRKIA